MDVEDSYEGAMRRLQRLEMAGIAIDSPPPSGTVDESGVDRMRELEELATLACEDNERLKGELGTARAELEGARAELEELRGHVAALEQRLASAQPAPASAPQPAFEPAPSPFAPSPFSTETSPEEDFGYPPKSSRKGVVYVFAVAAVAVAALFVLHPWDQPHAAAVVVEPPAPPAPVVTAPPPAAKVEPPMPKIAPTVPKIAPTVPKVAAAHEPRASKMRSSRKHAKHHAGKKHAAATAKEPAPDTSDDPLAGAGN